MLRNEHHTNPQASRYIKLAGVAVFVVVVLGLAMILPRMGGQRLMGRNVGSHNSSSVLPVATTTSYAYVADANTPLGEAQRFVSDYLAYRASLSADPVRAKAKEAGARSFLTASLSSSIPNLRDSVVYNDPGPGDEDGWPEPIMGSGSGDRYTLYVAFDSDAGEVANGGVRGQVSEAMQFDFVKVAGQWKISGMKRVNYRSQGQVWSHGGNGAAPNSEPTVPPVVTATPVTGSSR